MVERPAHNRLVAGPIPAGPTLIMQNKKQISRQKIFLATAFLLFSCLFLSITLSQTYFKKETTPPVMDSSHYQKILKQAFADYEAAESALIYKDNVKAKELLESSEKKAQLVINSPDLNSEAQIILKKIKEKRAILEKEKEEVVEK